MSRTTNTTNRPPAGGVNPARLAAVSAAEEAFALDQVDEALELLGEAEKNWPDDLTIPYLVGKYTADRKSVVRGIELLERVLERQPDHLQTLLELGNIHLKPGNVVRANPYIQRALESAPKQPAAHCSMGSLQQRIGNLPAAIEQYRAGLQLQLKAPRVKAAAPKKKADFRVHDAEGLLWKTLDLMASNGIHMFAAFGTLLGLTRNGGLLLHDKDIDTGIPHSEMPRALAILRRNGWEEMHRSFGLMNPRAMVNHQDRISMDVSGFVVDDDSGKALTAGAWMPGLPKEWNMIFQFDRIHLHKQPTPDGSGQAWCMTEPEVWLETIYGDWQKPDKNFDTMVRAHNIRSFSLLARCFAYSRVFEHWSKDNIPRALALARHTLGRDPSDHLMQKVVSRLNH